MKTEKGLVLGPFHTEMFETANLELRKLRYHLVFFSIDEAASSNELMKRINKKEFAGIMMVGWIDPKIIEALVKAGIPSILVDNYVRGLQLDSVLPDNEGGSYEAVRYLLDRGHRRIACIRAPLDQAAARERFRGYVNALADEGIPFDEKLVVEGNFQVDGGERAMSQLLDGKKNERPTAVFCLNDEMAIGAMKKIRQSGLNVPDQVSVVGFDDVDWAAHTFPPLTTVQVPKGELAGAAIKLLLQRMKTPSALPYKVLLPTALVERQSASRPPVKV
jgi:LacI family transcriptional regulator